jgi:hypothetical protein
VVAAVLCIAASSAFAERRRVIAVLDIRVLGVPKDIATKFEADLERQLDSRAYWLAPRARVKELMESSTHWTEGCVVGPCLAEVRTQTQADIVLLASISGSDTSFGYVITLMRTDNGRYLSQMSNRCEVCTVKEALTSATQAAIDLLTAVPETLPDDDAELRASVAQADKTHAAAHAATRRHHTRLAVTTLLAGIAVAAAGTVLYVTRDHADYGLATAAAGGGMALGGVIALTF